MPPPPWRPPPSAPPPAPKPAHGTCWVFSDPHVERFDGSRTELNLNPAFKGAQPVHTLAKWADGILQSYRCPALCGMSPPEYFPCGSTGVVAIAGRIRVPGTKTPHSFVLARDSVIVDGTAHDLGSAGHWAPTTIPVGKDGACTLSRIVNPSAASVAKLAGGKALSLREAQELDTIKMPGEYATVIECTGSGGAPVRVSTWNWKEAHMPTDYLMNTRIELPEEDAAGAGLCAGKALSECKDATVRALWPEALLADLKATCGNHVKSCPAGTKEPAATEEPTTAPPTTTEVTTTEAPPETKPEYTTFNKGAACEGNGAVSIKTLADCSAAGAALGLSDKTAVDDGQNGVSYDPSYCYFEGGSLKFNSAGTNTGDCTDKDTCVCLGECAGEGVVRRPRAEGVREEIACDWDKDAKECVAWEEQQGKRRRLRRRRRR